MAYITGTSGTFAELLAAVQAACTANGWTLTGNVLHKGTCFSQLTVVGNAVDVLGGMGLAGTAITGTPFGSARLQAVMSIPITFPATYEIFIHDTPDEVYVILNYAVVRYGWLAFGQSPAPGCPGTGNWQGAITPASAPFNGINISPTSGLGNAMTSAALGWMVSGASGTPSNSADAQNFRFQHGLDGNAWSSAGSTVGVPDGPNNGWPNGPSCAATAPMLNPLLARQPNVSNSEPVLLPLQPHVMRPSSKVSMVGNIAHARALRIDNYNPGTVIPLGSDRWKVYPWHMKNTAARDGGNGIDHTGTLGWAIRYDGP